MKILAVSDVVLPQMQDAAYLRRTFADAKLLVSCGDMPGHYLDVIGSTLNLPLFYVRGNHDEQYETQPPGGDNLHLKIRTFGEYSFAGLEGSINYNRGDIQYEEGQMFVNVLRLLPRLLLIRSMRGYGVDVMVTHSPPRHVHDLSDDRAHRGFQSFQWLMRWVRPRFLIHGHVDTWDNRKPTQTQCGKTMVININPYKLMSLDRN